MAELYDVVAQRPTTSTDAAGRFVDGTVVTIRTKPSGIVREVFVDAAHYHPDLVGPILADEAARAEGVHQL